jgi:hypothetical protein
MKEMLSLFFLTFYSLASATTYYVSTSGSDNNPGTISQPFATWPKGFSTIKAGDTLYIRGGTYYPGGTSFNSKNYGVVINNHDGTAENPIVVMNYPGEIPVIDCRNITTSTAKGGIYLLYSSYWHIKGLTVTRVDQGIAGYGSGGIIVHNSDNITVEQCAVHHIGGTGFHVAYNCNNILLINCDSYLNSDPHSSDAYGGADGFVIAQITAVNANNTLRGCRAWYNSDDGFDFFNNESHVKLEHCWSFHNGYIPDTFLKAGDGNGFKLGETSLDHGNTIVRTIINCIAYKNRTSGFHQNEAPAAMALYNNVAYLNGAQGFWFGSYNKIHSIKNNISFKNGAYCFISPLSIVSNNTFLINNAANPALSLTETDFVSLEATQLIGARKTDGSLPDITFLHLASGSDLIDAGINVGLPFNGQAPDIGAFETTPPTPVIANQPPAVSISSPLKSATFTSPASITVNAAASDPDGAIIKVEFFQGSVKIGERLTTPYSITWKEVPEGTYSLTAVATDNVNSKTVSAAVSITVVKPASPENKMPTVSISSPTKGSSFTAPATVTIDVNASDPDGSITKVELFNGAAKLYERTAAPYSFTLKDLPAGSYELKAVATDNMKASSTSSSIDLTVSAYIEARDYFNLYPNPNDGRFTIDFTTLMEAEIFTLTVVDLIGKTVHREELSKDESTRQFDLSHLNSGIYVLMIASNQILLTQKIIKN